MYLMIVTQKRLLFFCSIYKLIVTTFLWKLLRVIRFILRYCRHIKKNRNRFLIDNLT